MTATNNPLLSETLKRYSDSYNVEVFIKIEELLTSPSSTLHRTLSPSLKTEYGPDDRFVFLNFNTVNDTVLNHIISTVDRLDIPRFFIAVLSNQPTVVEFFKNNDIHSEFIAIENQEFTNNGVVPLFWNPTLCTYAWAGAHVYPNGTYRPCCVYTDDLPYNISSASPEEVLASPEMVEMRAQFREGITPSGCVNCVKQESIGYKSRRTLSPERLSNVYGNIDWESEGEWQFFGGHLGNLCNLKCRICSSDFSSKIAVEELSKSTVKKEHKSYAILENNAWTGKRPDFWDSLKAKVPQVCNFEFLGGEPLLHHEIIDFMQYFNDTGNGKDAIFDIVTNATQYHEFFEKENDFKKTYMTLSIDNIGERFELERHGAKWAHVEENVKKFTNLSTRFKNVHMGISITVNIQNVLYLPEFVEWLQRINVKDNVYFSFLTTPKFLSISHLTKDAADLVLQRLSTYDHPEIKKVVDYITNNVVYSDGKEFCEYMKSKDLLRNENFLSTHKDIAIAMGYVI